MSTISGSCEFLGVLSLLLLDIIVLMSCERNSHDVVDILAVTCMDRDI